MCCENRDKLRRRSAFNQTTDENESCFCDCAMVKKLKEQEENKKPEFHLASTGSRLIH